LISDTSQRTSDKTSWHRNRSSYHFCAEISRTNLVRLNLPLPRLARALSLRRASFSATSYFTFDHNVLRLTSGSIIEPKVVHLNPNSSNESIFRYHSPRDENDFSFFLGINLCFMKKIFLLKILIFFNQDFAFVWHNEPTSWMPMNDCITLFSLELMEQVSCDSPGFIGTDNVISIGFRIPNHETMCWLRSE